MESIHSIDLYQFVATDLLEITYFHFRYKLMLSCWEKDVETRPDFNEVKIFLENFIERHGPGSVSLSSTLEKKRHGSLSLQESVDYAEIQPVKANYLNIV